LQGKPNDPTKEIRKKRKEKREKRKWKDVDADAVML